MSDERQIYILLTDTGTILTRLIKWYTGDPLNHASLVLDCELKEIYSFGRKFPSNPFVGGFVEENLEGRLFGKATCALYRVSVNAPVYKRMRRRIEGMRRHRDQYKYNFLGLLGVMLNFRLERKDAYFCSQFVASVFEENGFPLADKPAALVTPGDLAMSPALQLVYQGSVRHLLFGGERKTHARLPVELANQVAY